VAEHADRIITIRDGEIQEDRRNESPVINIGAEENVLELLRKSGKKTKLAGKSPSATPVTVAPGKYKS
jgi:hypothetical protein